MLEISGPVSFLNKDHAGFVVATQDLSYLMPDRYNRGWKAKLAAAPLLRHVRDTDTATGVARLQYDSQKEYDGIGAYLVMIREWKVGGFCSVSRGSRWHRARGFRMLQQCA